MNQRQAVKERRAIRALQREVRDRIEVMSNLISNTELSVDHQLDKLAVWKKSIAQFERVNQDLEDAWRNAGHCDDDDGYLD